jgi:transcriptional regulator with XRE-family HTH domain
MHVVHNFGFFVAVITTIPQLIKEARNGRSQAEFARELGVEQSTLCRYEKGEANPKAQIIERCMHLVHWNNQISALTVDELADKVRSQLGREDQAPLRIALSKLIDGLVTEISVN